jgi:hypothetical protein
VEMGLFDAAGNDEYHAVAANGDSPSFTDG